MRNTLLGLVLGVVAGLIVAVGVTAGGPPGQDPAMAPLQDGLYRLADGKVICKVVGGWIACSNGRVQILCVDDRCSPHYLDALPEPYAIGAAEEASSAIRVLRPNISWDLGRMGCRTSRTHIECRVIDYLGGFQMSGLFARNVDWDDAPPGWPWDGRTHTVKDRVPGI